MFLQDEAETLAFGRNFGRELIFGDIVAFHGDLGAGKTTMIKGIIHALTGIEEREVQSPTFTTLNLYDGPPTIYHFDLYRMSNSQEFIEKGFLDFFGDGICLIEWPERIPSLLPEGAIHVTLEGNVGRRIDVQKS